MSEFHFIKDRALRNFLENIALILGAIGAVIAFLSLIL